MNERLERYATMFIGVGFTTAMVGLATTTPGVFLAGVGVLLAGCVVNFVQSVL